MQQLEVGGAFEYTLMLKQQQQNYIKHNKRQTNKMRESQVSFSLAYLLQLEEAHAVGKTTTITITMLTTTKVKTRNK